MLINLDLQVEMFLMSGEIGSDNHSSNQQKNRDYHFQPLYDDSG